MAGFTMPPAERTFSVISAHFGDTYWIRQLHDRVERLTSPGRIAEVLVVDQDRDGRALREIAALRLVHRVVQYPVNGKEVEVLGHDHPSALNHAVREAFSSSHVVIMDSDCFPLTDSWLPNLEARLDTADAVVAGDGRLHGFSHPCFMAFPSSCLGRLDFADGTLALGIDTGRLIAHQLVGAGYSVRIEYPTRAFNGRRGSLYLDRSVYHHGSGSFSSNDDGRLQRQVDAGAEAFYRQRIDQDQFHLSRRDQGRLIVAGLVRRARRRARRAMSTD